MNLLNHVVYASSAESQIGETELRIILDRAQIVNSQLVKTPILLHSEGSFFQVLEGNGEAIDTLYAKITRDKRHKNVVLIVREPIASRSFACWSMGFASVTSKDVAGIIDANDFFQKRSCFYQLNAGRGSRSTLGRRLGLPPQPANVRLETISRLSPLTGVGRVAVRTAVANPRIRRARLHMISNMSR